METQKVLFTWKLRRTLIELAPVILLAIMITAVILFGGEKKQACETHEGTNISAFQVVKPPVGDVLVVTDGETTKQVLLCEAISESLRLQMTAGERVTLGLNSFGNHLNATTAAVGGK